MSCHSWASTGIPLFPNGTNIEAGLQHNQVKAGLLGNCWRLLKIGIVLIQC